VSRAPQDPAAVPPACHRGRRGRRHRAAAGRGPGAVGRPPRPEPAQGRATAGRRTAPRRPARGGTARAPCALTAELWQVGHGPLRGFPSPEGYSSLSRAPRGALACRRCARARCPGRRRSTAPRPLGGGWVAGYAGAGLLVRPGGGFLGSGAGGGFLVRRAAGGGTAAGALLARPGGRRGGRGGWVPGREAGWAEGAWAFGGSGAV